MSKEKKEKIFELRGNGMTYQAIADELGCTKQYVHQTLKRIPSITKSKKQVNKRILHWCVDNDMKLIALCKALGEANGKAYPAYYNMLTDGSRALNTIKEILSYTGLTFEEVFGGNDSED